ncbi:hypothetical protein M0802_014053 [Mischocyttarus mexicanus]|nr:hypothetical protein M0802_014053 [Mischocyttarus mexicanus]
MEKLSLRKSYSRKEASYEAYKNSDSSEQPKYFGKKNINRVTSDSDSDNYKCCHYLSDIQYEDSICDLLQELVARTGGIVMVSFYPPFISCSETSTLEDVVAHINHIRKVAGVDHVGIGAGYDGINFSMIRYCNIGGSGGGGGGGGDGIHD